ncbi:MULTISPECIES: DUF3619 family protein [unclassified Variovorax]|uniref:DUF3619 family protein n=1 Tax=unclassified Variovorax TaxID=663243 RepID=UPI000B856381|nr:MULTISPECIES: DUF3619 family protein [unclassified Variovorax]
MNTQDFNELCAAEQADFGRKVAARLSGSSRTLPGRISDRLRIARAQALASHKRVAASQCSSFEPEIVPEYDGHRRMAAERMAVLDRLSADPVIFGRMKD